MMRFLFAVALLLAAFPAAAQTWEGFDALFDGKIYVYNKWDIVTNADKHLFVWMKSVGPESGRYSFAFCELDCVGRIRLLKEYEIVNGKREDRPAKGWEFVEPETVYAKLQATVCRQ